MQQEAADERGPSRSLLDLGQDILLRQVLQHVQLADLQALVCSCKQLEEWVKGVSEPTLLAAARNTFQPDYHPGLQSGDICAYLASQAARDAAFQAGPASWPCSIPREIMNTGPGLNLVAASHDRHTQVFADESVGDVMQLRSPTHAELSVQLPATHRVVRAPVFSPDDTRLALVMPSLTEVQGLRSSIVVVISLLKGAQYCSFELAPGKERHYSAPEWAGNSRRLCVHTFASEACPSPVFWVFDEGLSLLARFPGFATQLFWSSSADGLLLTDNTRALVGTPKWQWCVLPQDRSQEAVVSDPIPGFQQMEWGAFLPGQGEVIITDQKQREQTTLGCAIPDVMSKGLTTLGTLLTFPGGHWESRLQHVAVIEKSGAGLLRVYMLQPGPQLHLVLSREVEYPCHYPVLSPDSRYLLVINARWRKLPRKAQGLYAELMSHLSSNSSVTYVPMVVHISSGRVAEVLDLIPEDKDQWSGRFRAEWLASGFELEYDDIEYLVAFPGIQSKVPLS